MRLIWSVKSEEPKSELRWYFWLERGLVKVIGRVKTTKKEQFSTYFMGLWGVSWLFKGGGEV